MSVARFREAINRHVIEFVERPDKDLHPGYCLSLNCIPGRTAYEVAEFAKRPNPKVSYLTVADIHKAGFDIVPSDDSHNRWRKSGHCDVYVKEGCEIEPTDEQLQALSLAIRGAIDNPGRRNRTL